MAWIPMLGRDEATGKLAEVYARMPGELDHIIRACSLAPRALDALLVFYKGVMHGPCDLTMTERETIAVAVSQVNGCYY